MIRTRATHKGEVDSSLAQGDASGSAWQRFQRSESHIGIQLPHTLLSAAGADVSALFAGEARAGRLTSLGELTRFQEDASLPLALFFHPTHLL